MTVGDFEKGSGHNLTALDCGIFGLCIGDALGVPVEFRTKGDLTADPVEDMVGYGTHHKPPGTWSDDTSMALCLADSLAHSDGIDYADIMRRFSDWLNKSEYTSDGRTFDAGITCARAIRRFDQGTEALLCGDTAERSNGNGSLMRILPLVFYLHTKGVPVQSEAGLDIIHNVSALTHAHPRSKMSCATYCRCAELLMTDSVNKMPVQEMQMAIQDLLTYYSAKPGYNEEVELFSDLTQQGFPAAYAGQTGSTGYVIDTLKTALWCLWTGNTYRDTVLTAVNLGGDTDTNAAVAGGLAGIWYGLATDRKPQGIPETWVEQIVNRALIERICHDLSYQLGF